MENLKTQIITYMSHVVWLNIQIWREGNSFGLLVWLNIVRKLYTHIVLYNGWPCSVIKYWFYIKLLGDIMLLENYTHM